MITLYKVPQCAIAAQPIKQDQLKLVFCSMYVSMKRNDKSVFCCRREFDDESYFWWLQPHVQFEKEDAPAFISPAWFVECTKDTKLVNMEVVWKDRNDVQVPILQNNRPLKRGERLFREWCELGVCPEDIATELTKLARSSKRRQDNDANTKAGKAKK